MRNITEYTILIFVLILAADIRAIAQKTDTIIHINGNVLTGDFKKMAYGVITWKMEGMGTIHSKVVRFPQVISMLFSGGNDC